MKDINTELRHAVIEGNIDEVKKFVKLGANIRQDNDFLLILACQQGHLLIVQYLLSDHELDEHCDIHCRNGSAINAACCHGSLEVVKFLLTSPIIKNHSHAYNHKDNFHPFKYKSDPLHYACENENWEIVEFLCLFVDNIEEFKLRALEMSTDYALKILEKRELHIKLHTSLMIKNKDHFE